MVLWSFFFLFLFLLLSIFYLKTNQVSTRFAPLSSKNIIFSFRDRCCCLELKDANSAAVSFEMSQYTLDMVKSYQKQRSVLISLRRNIPFVSFRNEFFLFSMLFFLSTDANSNNNIFALASEWSESHTHKSSKVQVKSLACYPRRLLINPGVLLGTTQGREWCLADIGARAMYHISIQKRPSETVYIEPDGFYFSYFQRER